MQKKIKVALTYNSKGPSETTKVIFEKLQKSNFVDEIILLKIKHNPNKQNFRWTFLVRIENLINLIYNLFVSLKLLKKIEKPLIPDVSFSGYKKINLHQKSKNYFSYTSADNLAGLKIDVIIRGCGLMIEKGEILNKGSKYGLFSFHHGDNRQIRGGPWGFWESYYGYDSLGIIFQKLNKELDAGNVISRANIYSGLTWTENQNILLNHTGIVLEKALSNLCKSKFNDELYINKLYFNRLYRTPGLNISLLYLLSTLRKMVILIIKNLNNIILTKKSKFNFLKDNWKITLFQENKRIKDSKQILNISKEYWYADPFFSHINEGMILCEKYLRSSKKAIIVAYNFNNGIIEYKKEYTLIDNGTHASYPYTFKKGDKYYIIPEEGTKGVNLYQLIKTNNGLKCNKIKNLFPSGYVDASYLKHNGLDFIFVNPPSKSKVKSVLEIYYTTNILTDELKAHPQNPIMIDSRFARSAGRIWTEKNLIFRPSQNCLKFYGRSLDISIIEVSKTNFSTLPFKSFELKNNNGQLHHFEKFKINNRIYNLIDSNGFL